MTTLELELVVLLDESRRAAGTAAKSSVHTADTPLHLAFSLYLFDADGRVLMTRRSLAKKTWPGVWTNTCCGHPAPGESMAAAIDRRLRTELGTDVVELRQLLPEFAYRATDASGIVENEFCPVFAGLIGSTPVSPNPAEVAEYAWLPWTDLLTAMRSAPFAFSPWAVEQVPLLAPVLDLPAADRGRS